MGDHADAGTRGRRAAPARDTLPKVAVNSREEMAVVLLRHHRLLREYARYFLLDATDDVVEAAVERTVDALLAAEHPSAPHALRLATRVLYHECRRTSRRLERERVPVDPYLGPLTGRVARVLERLGPRSRDTIVQTARGVPHAEIARNENTSRETIRVRLYRARRRALELLNDGGQTSAALLLLPHRVRAFFGRSGHAIAGEVSPHVLATGTLVPLIISSLLWAVAPTVAPSRASSVTLSTVHTGLVPAGSADAAPAPAGRRPSWSPGWQRATASISAVPAALRSDLHGAAAETPDDVTLNAVATPADGSPVVVAIGRGNTCTCSVLMRSLDGGATWAATDGPRADANQLAIPPAYPSDPRIFAGVDPLLGSTPYMAAAFGQPFVPLSTLPPGQVAVSAHFDDGDPRLFAAGVTAVWSIAIGGSSPSVPHDEADYSTAGATTRVTAALATPTPSVEGSALLAWLPALATIPGSAGGAMVNPAVVQCPVAGPCATLSSLPVSPWRLDTRGATKVLAYSDAAAYISRDGGRSFTSLPLPKGTAVVASMVLAGENDDPWISFERRDQSSDVARLLPARGGWVDATGESTRARTHLGVLVAVSGDRIIEAFSALGYRCTTVAEAAWTPRCPAV